MEVDLFTIFYKLDVSKIIEYINEVWLSKSYDSRKD